MTKAEIVEVANQLIEMLAECNDDEFVDEVISAVAENGYLDISDYDEDTYESNEFEDEEEDYDLL